MREVEATKKGVDVSFSGGELAIQISRPGKLLVQSRAVT
jgi:hypothetical protein